MPDDTTISVESEGFSCQNLAIESYGCVSVRPFNRRISAQSTLGTITGLVTDSTGSVIPSAVVAATNTATGVRAQTVSSGPATT